MKGRSEQDALEKVYLRNIFGRVEAQDKPFPMPGIHFLQREPKSEDRVYLNCLGHLSGPFPRLPDPGD